MGTKQTGLISFRIADLERDSTWLDVVKQAAQEMQKHPKQTKALIRRWIGSRQQFAEV